MVRISYELQNVILSIEIGYYIEVCSVVNLLATTPTVQPNEQYHASLHLHLSPGHHPCHDFVSYVFVSCVN